MGRMVASCSLGGVMVSTLARNARDVASIPALGNISLLSHPLDSGCSDHNPVQATRCMVVDLILIL